MSMSEPLLPHPAQDDDRTVAAEPGGEGAPAPESPEEPDVLTGPDQTDDAGADTRPNPLFRTPVPGDSLSADELAAETGDRPRSPRGGAAVGADTVRAPRAEVEPQSAGLALFFRRLRAARSVRMLR